MPDRNVISGQKLAIERDGNEVVLRLICESDHAAKLIFEHFVNEAKGGTLKLEMDLLPAPANKQ